MLRHLVFMQFKSTCNKASIHKIERAFERLPSQIPQISEFEWGLNNSPEGLNKGFTHCFMLSFETEADRAIYLPHPKHEAFKQLLEGHLEDVLVLDYYK